MKQNEIKASTNKKDKPDKTRNMTLIALVALGTLTLVGVLVKLLFLRVQGESQSDGESNKIFPYWLIWSALWIPILASRNRQMKEEDYKKNLVPIIIGLLAFLVSLGGLLYIIMTQNQIRIFIL